MNFSKVKGPSSIHLKFLYLNYHQFYYYFESVLYHFEMKILSFFWRSSYQRSVLHLLIKKKNPDYYFLFTFILFTRKKTM